MMSEAGRDYVMTDKDFSFLSTLIKERAGIVINPNKRSMLYSRLVRRVRELRLDSFASYCSALQSAKADQELPELINAVTTNLTRFFREPHHFEHLRDVALQEAMQQALTPGSPKRLRLWSAGCSSGEEPYSIALTLLESGLPLSLWDAKILATDLDSNMLATASAGQYDLSHDSTRDLPVALRDKYFTVSQQQAEAKHELKRLITFRQLNLLHAWPMQGSFDVIFCRNVLIYFDKPTQKNLLERFAKLLRPGGFLYIGHSENTQHLTEYFTPEKVPTTYRRNS